MPPELEVVSPMRRHHIRKAALLPQELRQIRFDDSAREVAAPRDQRPLG